MATGHDILGFWVHRMVILGMELTGKNPFYNVLLHGIICDNKGKKMSKSKGNIIDPIDVINGISIDQLKQKTKEMHRDGILNKEEMQKAISYQKANFSQLKGIPNCGVDALRFTLLSHDIKSHFVNFDINICHSNKLFGNKIWQSIKYTQFSFAKLKDIDVIITREDLTYFDRWILSRLSDMVKNVNLAMDSYDFHIATKALRSFIYNEFCDVYLEATKPGFESENCKVKYAHAHTLSAVLNTSLRCLSPFMIYLTEELVPTIPAFENNIIVNFDDDKQRYFDFPKTENYDVWKNNDLEVNVAKLLHTLYLIRELKGFYSLPTKIKPSIFISTTDENLKSELKCNESVILKMTKCSKLLFDDKTMKDCVTAQLDKNTRVSVEVTAQVANTAKKKNFYLLSLFTTKLKLSHATWLFYESRHGKSMADGVGGAVKRQLDKRIAYGHDVTNASKAFHVLENSMKSGKCFYINSQDVENTNKLILDTIKAVA
ncbi:hypothetical protein ACJJTC_012929 [Scirpophaga incertulas]